MITVKQAIKKYKLDKRRKWFFFCGNICYSWKYSRECSGCDGGGCFECGGSGKRRDAVPVPAMDEKGNPINVYPILRPLSDMTEEEEKQYHKIRETGYTSNVERQMLNDAAGTKYLLSLGFDLFNLIPDGLAINKSSLKNS